MEKEKAKEKPIYNTIGVRTCNGISINNGP
jgi:hypothetical protein